MKLSKLAYLHLVSMVAYPFLYRGGNHPDYGMLDIVGNDNKPVANKTLSLTTWNIGYAALGAKANFAADGGNDLRALKRAEIAIAAEEIGREAATFDTDMILFQELAQANYLTRQVKVIESIETHLKRYSASFWEGLRLPYVPKFLQLSHGMGIYSRFGIEETHALKMPAEPGSMFAGIKKHYAITLTDLPIEGSDKKWVIINVHLSAFDEGANIRQAQIRAVFDTAQQEYSRGNYVIIGGDWNMRLSKTDFPHIAKGENKFVVHEFPIDRLPEDWSIAADDDVPTVRALHKPYIQGVNNTMIIDGFVVSPNVAIDSVKTKDLQFEHTDHHPVTGVFSVK